MPRRKRSERRTPTQAAADRAAAELSRRLEKMPRDARRAALLTQKQAAVRAGITQATWSDLEVRANARFTVATWNRAITAVGRNLHAYVSNASAADQPKDAVHLRHQELT